MSREKVSISLDKDEKGPRSFNNTHMVKAMSLTSWHLTNFSSASVIPFGHHLVTSIGRSKVALLMGPSAHYSYHAVEAILVDKLMWQLINISSN